MKRVAVILAVLYLSAALLIYTLRPITGRQMIIFGDTLPVIAAALAAAAGMLVALKFRRSEPHRFIWLLLSLGLTLWLLGEVSWWILEIPLGQSAPFPSIADFFWLTGYVPLITGFWLNYRRLNIKLPPAKKWSSIFVLASAAILSVNLILYPIVTSNISVVEQILDLAYPLGDLMILTPAFFTLLALGKGFLGRPWRMMVGGFIVMALADLAFSFLSQNDLYQTGNPVDLFWVSGYAIIGIASLSELEFIALD